MTTRRLSDDTGAEAVEFALAAPVVLFLVFGLVYALVGGAAYLSLNHAASRTVRFASIPTDPVHSVYPTPADVASRFDDSTPFFSADDCDIEVAGPDETNQPVVLHADCRFPNPLGRVVARLASLVGGEGGDDPDHITLSVTANARRE